jgi:hypothetical protein
MMFIQKFSNMKPFLILSIFCLGLVFTAKAQDNTYTPNARQAVQKSRMQQPQYFELTRDSSKNQEPSMRSSIDQQPVNYQLERPIAIDAPKRRGKKSSESNFMKLAANSSKQ